MDNVRQLLRTKGSSVWTVSPDSTVYQALELMAEKDIGALVVTKDGEVIGMFSERDYARKIILKGKSSMNTTVGELMSKQVFYVTPENTIEECMGIMTQKHIRHLPVIKEKELIGLISIGDVVNQVIKHQKFKIRELEKYITGGYRL